MDDKKKLRNVLIFTFLISIAIGQWIGGVIFFKFNVINSIANPFTLISFWYGGQAWEQNLIYRISFVVACIFPVVMTIGAAILLTQKPKRELHGSSRFALMSEITQHGLFKTNQKDPEILIGKFNGKFLRWSGKQFAYLAAPTRSGKGVGIVIPNCLNYRDSLVVFDPKLENFKITAGYRHDVMEQDIYLFNPSAQNKRSHCWNPMSYVSRDPYRMVGDAFNIANILYTAPEGGDSGNAKFFAEMAQKLFVGLVLYMIEYELLHKDTPEWNEARDTPTLTRLNALTTPDPSKYKNCAVWIKEEVAKSPYFSNACKNNLLSYATTSDQTAASIMSSMVAPLSVFIDPIVGKITSKDDFNLRDLRKKKMSIYIGIQPNDLAKFSRLINLFISQLISVNTEELPEDNPDLKYQCLLLLDEFTGMGKVDIIEKSVAYIAGYNLRLMPIFQNLSQLNRLYTKDGAKSMSTNFECQIIYPPRDNEDAKEFSEIIGHETFKAKSTSKNKGSIGNSSTSISDQRRPVMLPEELRTMPTTDCIISMTGIAAIRAKKIVYYEDPEFTKRLGYPPPEIPLLDLPNLSAAKQDTTTKPTQQDEVKEVVKYMTDIVDSSAVGLQKMVEFGFGLNNLSDDIRHLIKESIREESQGYETILDTLLKEAA